MPLEEYRRKRDFSRTREPLGRGASSHALPIFVIQEHHATRLHYDFRIEEQGVLKSWAVPKQPTMNPNLKRLAIQVEDHPLEYASFAGTIPEGQYGGGTVAIWDRGTYQNLMADKPEPQTVAEAIEAGHVEIFLHGERLNGRFALVRMKRRRGPRPEWLLVKMKDEYARPDADDPPAEPKGATAPRKRNDASSDARRTTKQAGEVKRVTISHPDKMMYPDAGITKDDVVRYYERVSDWLLPYLKDRPATLERLPDGVGDPSAPHFWQKNTPKYYPEWIPRAIIPTEAGKPVHYCVINDLETLRYLVNEGALTIHVWASRVSDIDRPDFVLFDLDTRKATFADAVAVAKRLREILESKEKLSFLKTSGKTGLHVLTPWQSSGGFDEARVWARTIAGQVVSSMPDTATLEMRKSARGKRVYIDVLQNARGHHAVPPYVLRAVPGAPISWPLDWSRLSPSLEPAAFNLKSAFRYLARRKHDPFEDFVRGFSG